MDKYTFSQIAESVTMREVLSYYVTPTNKDVGRIPCPIHNGKHNNFSYNNRVFYCFSCGAKGNAISFVSQINGISNREAAIKIDADFSLGIIGNKPSISVIRKIEKQRKNAEIEKTKVKAIRRKIEIYSSIHRLAWGLRSEMLFNGNYSPGLFSACINLIIEAENRLQELNSLKETVTKGDESIDR